MVVLLLLVVAGAGYLFRERLFGLGPVVETGLVTRVGGTADAAVLTANGYVVARRQAGVTPKVSGRIKVLHKDLGDHVTKDEVLAELDNADLLASLDEAKATLWVSDLTADRNRKLAEQKVGSQSDADIALARAKEAAARVKNLEEQIDNTKVRAPFDGTIVVKNGEVGETVSLFGAQTARKSGPIFVVADFHEFEVEADVNESNIAKIAEGQPAEVALDAVPNRLYKGRLRQIVPTADRQKATIQVKVSLLDPDEHVYPEMSAKVSFVKSDQVASEPSRVVAPADAVVESGAERAAFVVDAGHVRRVRVECGASVGGYVTITHGLDGGETVVRRPPADLADGQRVRLAESK
ncbi:MAG: efflux RND transporter periplasmic adaptor subunit [Planctomycetes bacterium]|nr:efflux RND transporter periplasmic adaptor subunit [Planctomycetota bacterium]